MKSIVAIFAMASLLVVFPLASMSVSPAGYWTFNDEADPAKDDTGQGADGRASGPVMPFASDAPVPNPGFAMSFQQEAGNAVIIDNSDGLYPDGDATLMAWVNADDAAPTQFVAGFPYDESPEWDNPWIGFQIGVRSDGMANWIALPGPSDLGGREANDKGHGDHEFNTEIGTVLGATWQHIAMVHSVDDGTSAYINGELIHEQGVPGTICLDGSPAFLIGERSSTAPGEPFGGLIDEVAIFHSALTQDQITAVMNNGADLSGVGTAVESVGRLTTTWGRIKDR